MVWWLRPYCDSMRCWFQSLMDTWIHAIYKHIHNGEYTSHLNGVQKNLGTKSKEI